MYNELLKTFTNGKEIDCHAIQDTVNIWHELDGRIVKATLEVGNDEPVALQLVGTTEVYYPN